MHDANGGGLEGAAGFYVPAGIGDEVEAAVDEDAVGGVAEALPVGFQPSERSGGCARSFDSFVARSTALMPRE